MRTATPPPVHIRVIRSAEREHHRADGILGRFSFPFTGNFDLTQHAHGALLVHNDDLISARSGVDSHRHQEMEILTWIVDGRVVHENTAGHRAELTAGMMQRMSAGTGVLHSEQNADPSADARVVQMWVPPDVAAPASSYEQVDLNDALLHGGVVTAASGRDEESSLHIANGWVSLDVARPGVGTRVDFAEAPFHHFYVTRGSVAVRVFGLDDRSEAPQQVDEGDALRVSNARLLNVEASEDAEVLVWRMHAHF